MTGRLILVLGSGRSGTHLLGHILDGHPEITAAIEEATFFRPVTAMALDARERSALWPKLVDDYRARLESIAPQHLADKSHPNIWLAEDLADAFPEARFVGIQRSVGGTVASMLKHSGVLSWHDRWREFPVPNRFLGITERNAPHYDDLSTVAKCVLRWWSHRERMLELCDRLGDKLTVIDYEALVEEPAPVLIELARNLGLNQPLLPIEIRAESLERWRSELTVDQLREIDEVLSTLSA
jgi:LPS sulfotransferase NodH